MSRVKKKQEGKKKAATRGATRIQNQGRKEETKHNKRMKI